MSPSNRGAGCNSSGQTLACWGNKFVNVLASKQLFDKLWHFSHVLPNYSISFVPNVRNPSWVIVTTKNVGLPIVKRIIISYLATCALYATKLYPEMVTTHLWLLEHRRYSYLFQFVVFTALNKAWCVHHFACSVCDTKMTQKSKFYEYDEKPVCKKCYEKFPGELRRRLRTAHENTMKKTA